MNVMVYVVFGMAFLIWALYGIISAKEGDM